MPRQRQTKGVCSYCNQEIGKGFVARHLASCEALQQAIEQADSKSKGERQTLYHLRVRDAYNNLFWMDLEMRGDATLKTLDDYLRAIWLECCGHLSQFEVGGAWSDNEIGMSRKAKEVFEPGAQLTHTYDFGDTSETVIEVVDERAGAPLTTTRRPITLLVRNVMPQMQCIECDQTATHLCMECVIEQDTSGLLCAEHAADHPHEDYGGPLELVNSPRMGMCGYDGPAEAPY